MLTLDEGTKALKLMANNKSPGSDGLAKELYAKVWTLVGQDLVDVFNTAFRASHLPEPQRSMIVTLVYRSWEKADIKNWRPICLLNIGFKMLSNCLVNRLKQCMNTTVHQDQTCGIKGRSIFENILFVQDAICK